MIRKDENCLSRCQGAKVMLGWLDADRGSPLYSPRRESKEQLSSRKRGGKEGKIALKRTAREACPGISRSRGGFGLKG